MVVPNTKHILKTVDFTESEIYFPIKHKNLEHGLFRIHYGDVSGYLFPHFIGLSNNGEKS